MKVEIHYDAPLLPEMWVKVQSIIDTGIITNVVLPGMPALELHVSWEQITGVSMSVKELRQLTPDLNVLEAALAAYDGPRWREVDDAKNELAGHIKMMLVNHREKMLDKDTVT